MGEDDRIGRADGAADRVARERRPRRGEKSTRDARAATNPLDARRRRRRRVGSFVRLELAFDCDGVSARDDVVLRERARRRSRRGIAGIRRSDVLRGRRESRDRAVAVTVRVGVQRGECLLAAVRGLVRASVVDEELLHGVLLFGRLHTV